MSRAEAVIYGMDKLEEKSAELEVKGTSPYGYGYIVKPGGYHQFPSRKLLLTTLLGMWWMFD